MNGQPTCHLFLDDLSENVTMVSSVLRHPVQGRDLVSKIIIAA